MSENVFVQPEGLHARPTYTHVVVSERRKTVFVSGQVANDVDGQLIGAGSYAAQAEQVFANLARALAAVGATFADVTKMTTYVVGLDAEARAAISEVRSRFVVGPPPANTMVGVTALAEPGWLLEVEATATLD